MSAHWWKARITWCPSVTARAERRQVVAALASCCGSAVPAQARGEAGGLGVPKLSSLLVLMKEGQTGKLEMFWPNQDNFLHRRGGVRQELLLRGRESEVHKWFWIIQMFVQCEQEENSHLEVRSWFSSYL